MRRILMPIVVCTVLLWSYLPAMAGTEILQQAATATGAGTVLQVPEDYPYQTIQVTITGTATVQCQASLDKTNFETLGTLTATGSCVTEGAWRYIRANISACTACTVTAKGLLAQ